MKHETYKEWILLSLLGELGHDERRALETHLAGCAACRIEAEEAGAYITRIGEAQAAGLSDEILREARRELREALDRGEIPGKDALLADRAAEGPDGSPTRERAWSAPGRPGFPAGALRGWLGWFSPARAALAATAAVAVGFLAGYIVFGRTAGTFQESPQPSTAWTEGEREMGAPSYDNVRLAGIDPRTNQVEIEYDMVRPVRLRADIEDDRVQKILARAVMNDENAGARLRAINTIGAYVDVPPDREIKNALIHAAKTDPNAGVRKQALYVLYQLPFDGDIKDACLHVLSQDENEGLRIAAINILAVAVLDGNLKGEDVFNAVGARLQKDENEYIRIRSESFLQEVNGHGN